jgi:YVTN family beta-propeller protein
MMPGRGSIAFAAALLIGSILNAQSTPENSILVLSKRDRTLAIVDPSTLKVVARVPVGDDPHEVIASSDGRTAYVSNYGGGSLHTLAVIDLVAQKALEPIDLSPLRGPHGLTFVGGKTWFTVEGSKAIGSYDPALKKIDWVLGTGQNRTHMIYVADDLKHIVTTNVSSGTVSLIEKNSHPPGQGMPPPPPDGNKSGMTPGPRRPMGMPGGDWDETVVKVGNGSEGFDISPGGKEIWIANAQDGTISIIDYPAKQVSQTLAADVTGANRLKFTKDGRLVLVSTLNGEALTIIDAESRKTVKRLKIGHGAAGILIDPDGIRAYIACTPDGYVVVIDLKSLETIAKIDAGPEPDGMAWASRR